MFPDRCGTQQGTQDIAWREQLLIGYTSAGQENPLSCSHKARANHQALVMCFRDSRQKPQLRTASRKEEAMTLVSFLCLDCCYHIGQ